MEALIAEAVSREVVRRRCRPRRSTGFSSIASCGFARSVAEGHDCLIGCCARSAKIPSNCWIASTKGRAQRFRSQFASDGRKLVKLALHVHGPAALSHLSEALKDNGLGPPGRWGTQDAREFVAALGFPPEFSVSPSRSALRSSRCPALCRSGTCMGIRRR